MRKNHDQDSFVSYPIYGGTNLKKKEVLARLENEKLKRELAQKEKEKNDVFSLLDKTVGKTIVIKNTNTSTSNSSNNLNSKKTKLNASRTSLSNSTTNSNSLKTGSGILPALFTLASFLLVDVVPKIFRKSK